MAKEGKANERKSRSLSAFSILLIILVALAIITMVMAASGVDGVEGATIADVTTAPILGFADALPVCLFVLVLGGFLGIVAETGALDAGIGALVKKMHGKEKWLIPILMLVFSIGGTTYGMWEETVPFCLLLAAAMVAAGYDSLTGAAIVLLGAGSGVLGSTVNPFAVGVAVDAISGSGIEVNQGIIIGLGAVFWMVALVVSIVYVMRYARKVRHDPAASCMSDTEWRLMESDFGAYPRSAMGSNGKTCMEAVNDDGTLVGAGGASTHVPGEVYKHPEESLSGKQKATLVVFGLTFAVMIIGFIPWTEFGIDIWGWTAFLTGEPLGNWYFNEASTWFLLMAIIIGFVAWLGEGRFVKAFLNGAADMISVVLVIAVARSVTVLMGETGLDVWLLNQAAGALAGLASFVFAPLVTLLFMGLSVLIPSSSGLATVSMPIMAPLADSLGCSVEATIMAFVCASGVVNMITPTSGALVGGLALAKLDYSTWARFFLKLFVILAIICLVVVTIAMVALS